MVYLYCRVSTKGQANDGNSLEDQMLKLLKVYPNGKVYEEAFTGTKKDRPVFSTILESLKDGDIIAVTKLDRFARSVHDGSELLKLIVEKGATLHIVDMDFKIDKASLSDPFKKMQYDMFMAFAEFERNMIVMRTQEGKAIKRANNPNYKEGPKTKINDDLVKLYFNQGLSYNEIAAKLPPYYTEDKNDKNKKIEHRVTRSSVYRSLVRQGLIGIGSEDVKNKEK